MTARRYKQMAILHAMEVDYAVDVVPAAADALIASNVTFNPMEGEEVSRDLMLPYLGNQGIILAGLYASLEFDIEVAGAGAAGDVPPYGSLLRVCGLAETVTAGVSVVYSIVEDGLESGSLYFIQDGVRHILLGCRGTVSMNFTPKGIPQYRFRIIGLLGTISDVAENPAVSALGLTTPLIVSKANTALTLHGWNAVAESVSFDLGNEVTPRFLIGDERIKVTDRNVSGNAVVEARLMEEINWFEIATARTRGALSLTHGTADGNVVQIEAPNVEVGRPTQGQTNNVVNYTLPLAMIPGAGRDELVITVR
ncbi:phage tail tube protein [uncultured Tateyamaria sp.]|uniref:phage tail tube protein n=1 Tax=uncultured Tateyamaria sp. TaxID=455651 RepID=UPI00260B31F3|nr:phage tail tube protein [uncultured Tateyamaria sp.]